MSIHFDAAIKHFRKRKIAEQEEEEEEREGHREMLTELSV